MRGHAVWGIGLLLGMGCDGGAIGFGPATYVTKSIANASSRSGSCVIEFDAPACYETFVDHDCDITPSCEGGVLGPSPDSPCPVCLPAVEGDTCEMAEQGLPEMLAHTVPASCANWCNADEECFAFKFDTACGEVCAALQGGIDEETEFAIQEYATRRCGLCGDTEVTVERLGATGHCVDHRCVFAEEEAE